MRVLVIGGTRFIGRHLVDAAQSAGHDVTVFHRGLHSSEPFGSGPLPVERILGDRNDSADLVPLAKREWEATIDTCAYFPRQVGALADALGASGGRYVLISSTAVYLDPAPNYDESAPLVQLTDIAADKLDGSTYGGLKALCEQTALENFGPTTRIIRPTYVIGPGDYTWRFPWWVARLAKGGEVLAPGPPDDPAQVIDVRDLAAWVISQLRSGTPRDRGGTFHAVGPAEPLSWAGLLSSIAETVGGPGTRLIWVDPAFLREAELSHFAFPLWHGNDADIDRQAANPGAARAAGLQTRPLPETVTDTLAWIRTARARRQVPVLDIGLEPERERALLAAWHSGHRPAPS